MKKLKTITPLVAAGMLCASIPFSASATCSPDGAYIASMCPFAGNFAPRGSAFAHGQLLSISSNTALFSLVGTMYGGDGRTSFGLPDLRGRVAIHQGRGPGLSSYRVGQKGGAESVTLVVANMPSHNHSATLSASLSANNTDLNTNSTVTFKGANSVGNTASPSGSALAQLSGRRARLFSTSAPDAVMSNDAAVVSVGVDSSGLSVSSTSSNSGSTQSHENRQPYVAVNWIITLFGVYPSRS